MLARLDLMPTWALRISLLLLATSIVFCGGSFYVIGTQCEGSYTLTAAHAVPLKFILDVGSFLGQAAFFLWILGCVTLAIFSQKEWFIVSGVSVITTGILAVGFLFAGFANRCTPVDFDIASDRSYGLMFIGRFDAADSYILLECDSLGFACHRIFDSEWSIHDSQPGGQIEVNNSEMTVTVVVEGDVVYVHKLK